MTTFARKEIETCWSDFVRQVLSTAASVAQAPQDKSESVFVHLRFTSVCRVDLGHAYLDRKNGTVTVKVSVYGDGGSTELTHVHSLGDDTSSLVQMLDTAKRAGMQKAGPLMRLHLERAVAACLDFMGTEETREAFDLAVINGVMAS